MTRRFWVSTGLTAPLLLLAMGMLLPGQPIARLESATALHWVELALAGAVVLGAGRPLLTRAWLSLVRRSLNMFTLIGLGVLVAFFYSVAATIAPSLFPESMRDAHGRVGVYFEVAAAIVTLVLLGPSARTPRAKPHQRRHPRAPRALGQDRPRSARERIGRGCSTRTDPGWRPAPRAARRKGPRGRSRARGRERDRRVDGERRALSGGQEGGGSRHRRHAERDRIVRHAGRARGLGHPPRADRADGGGGAAEPRPDPEARGPGVRLVRPRRHPRRGAGVRGLGSLRSRAPAGVRRRDRGLGAHHRVPLRARPRDAHLHHGGDGSRSDRRHSLPKRRGD